MKRKIVRIELIPGKPMSSCEWLPPNSGEEIVVDQITMAVVMTLLGKNMTVADADAAINNLPHSIDELACHDKSPKPNYDTDNYGLP